MNPGEKPARGRRKTAEVRRLRTRIWYRSVELGLGVSSSYAVERRLEPDKVKAGPDGVFRPRKWDKYKAGKSVPIDRDDDDNSVNLAEAAAAGTARWFRSPIWNALEGKLTRGDVEAALWAHELLRPILFEQHWAPAWELAELDDIAVAAIGRIDGLDLLELTLLYLELSQTINSHDLRIKAIDLYFGNLRRISEIPALDTNFGHLFDAIGNRYRQWLFVRSTRKLDVFFPWRSELPDKAHLFPSAPGILDRTE